MAQQTATDWLFEQLWDTQIDKLTWYAILEKAKQLEKKQIEDAWEDGKGAFSTRQPEQYYNETYNKS